MLQFNQTVKLTWAGRILSILISLPLIMSAVMKFMGGAQVAEGMVHLGIPQNLLVPLGVIELSCVVIYLVPQTAMLGAILLTGYMGGTIITHLRVGEPPVLQVLFGVLFWLGLFLREPRVRQLMPFIKSQK